MYLDKKKDTSKKVPVQEQDNIGAFFQTCKVKTKMKIMRSFRSLPASELYGYFAISSNHLFEQGKIINWLIKRRTS